MKDLKMRRLPWIIWVDPKYKIIPNIPTRKRLREIRLQNRRGQHNEEQRLACWGHKARNESGHEKPEGARDSFSPRTFRRSQPSSILTCEIDFGLKPYVTKFVLL